MQGELLDIVVVVGLPIMKSLFPQHEDPQRGNIALQGPGPVPRRRRLKGVAGLGRYFQKVTGSANASLGILPAALRTTVQSEP